MKFPVSSSAQNSSKIRNPASTRSSASNAPDKPVQAKKTDQAPVVSDVLSQTDDALVQFDETLLQSLDDWDNIMRELALNEDPASTLKAMTIPQLTSGNFHDLSAIPQQLDQNHLMPSDFGGYVSAIAQNCATQNQHFNFSNSNFGTDYLGELIQAAECFEANDLQVAQMILARLNQRLQSPVGKPLHRAAFYLTEALHDLLTGTNHSARSSSSDIVQTIKAYKAFSAISPIPLFSTFTANQALLEALHNSSFIHIIDFDIGLGGQYASFMRDIADRTGNYRFSRPVVRITAIVPEEYSTETRLITENLLQFAQELKLGFHIEFVLVRTFEVLFFRSIKFIDGEKTAVLLSPAIFRRIGSGFVKTLRQISPDVVVFVDNEGCTDSAGTSFRRNFVEALQFYSELLESLDAAAGGGEAAEWVGRIENFLIRPKIFEAMEAGLGKTASWREAMRGAGMRAVGLSQSADFQAECLVRKAQVMGFHVAKRQGELVLCWHRMGLVATSAWKCVG